MNKNNTWEQLNENFKKLCDLDLNENVKPLERRPINEVWVNYRESNGHPIQRVDEMTVDRLLGRHYDSGFTIISACRGENGPEENNRRTRELLDSLKRSNFSFVPVYGGYVENKGTEEEKQVYEPSFVILAFSKEGKQIPFKEVYDFTLDAARKYNQEAFLSKEPGRNPRYVKQNEEVDMEFTGDVSVNDLTQEYFTSFIKSQNLDKNQERRRQSRFSFESVYVNPAPQTYGERYSRHRDGEIFLTR